MNPVIVHRYSLPLEEIIKAMIGPAECSKVDAVIVGENLVVDLLGPLAEIHSVTVEPGEELPQPETPPSLSPARKGGALAQRAGILCNEGAFQLWAEVRTPDAAKAFLYQRCGVESRVDLDYEPEAAAKFRDMAAEYEAWLSAPE